MNGVFLNDNFLDRLWEAGFAVLEVGAIKDNEWYHFITWGADLNPDRLSSMLQTASEQLDTKDLWYRAMVRGERQAWNTPTTLDTEWTRVVL